MPDREKVINGLEWILNDIKENGHYQVDNYEDEIREALVLLKEQEPVKFKVIRQDKSYPFWDSVCTGCGYKTSTVNIHWKYCPVCGRKVKWDE